MLIFNFKRLFKARGIDRPFSYMVNLGYSDNFATRTANNRVSRLDLKQIEKLCKLLHCTPNDMLEWIPDNQEEVGEDHPLISLKRTDKMVHLTQMLNSIPLDKLQDIEDLIKNEIKKDK